MKENIDKYIFTLHETQAEIKTEEDERRTNQN